MVERPNLIVRGDLQSETGWSKATRALARCLRPVVGEIYGVDIHYHPQKSKTRFGFPVIDEAFATKLIAGRKTIVLHACLPHHFERIPYAVNVGWFFWENEQIPEHLNWVERCHVMDALFVPSQWQREAIQRAGIFKPIHVLPWPFIGLDRHVRGRLPLPELSVHRVLTVSEINEMHSIDGEYWKSRQSLVAKPAEPAVLWQRKIAFLERSKLALPSLCDRLGGYFMSVMTDVPRKGLCILLSEWARFKEQNQSNTKGLVVKFSSIDINLDIATVFLMFCETVITALRGRSVPNLNVYVTQQQMSDSELTGLYSNADAFVTGTYAEGFGGPIVESFMAGSLAIAPSHTACRELMASEYPYSYESKPMRSCLAKQLAVYPKSSIWHVANEGAICDALTRFSSDASPQHHEAWELNMAHMHEVLDFGVVRQQFAWAIDDLNALEFIA
jgi:hypothetical protein